MQGNFRMSASWDKRDVGDERKIVKEGALPLSE
jgi:hypothetical protein